MCGTMQSVRLRTNMFPVRNSHGPTGLRKLIGTSRWPSSMGLLIGPSLSSLFAHGWRSSPLNCDNDYLVHEPEEETAVQAVDSNSVRGFRRLKKPSSREMISATVAAFSCCPQFWNKHYRFHVPLLMKEAMFYRRDFYYQMTTR